MFPLPPLQSTLTTSLVFQGRERWSDGGGGGGGGLREEEKLFSCSFLSSCKIRSQS